MNLERCLQEGLIKRDHRARDRVEKSLDIAEKFLRSAVKNQEIKENEMAEIAAYNSAFHSARALLFARGYVERSHYCLGIALKCLYQGKILEHLNVFDKIRISRHNVQYGGAQVGDEEAEFVIDFCRDFLQACRSELTEIG
jgi:uncharacterized protein (UPF0332 family)